MGMQSNTYSIKLEILIIVVKSVSGGTAFYYSFHQPKGSVRQTRNNQKGRKEIKQSGYVFEEAGRLKFHYFHFFFSFFLSFFFSFHFRILLCLQTLGSWGIQRKLCQLITKTQRLFSTFVKIECKIISQFSRLFIGNPTQNWGGIWNLYNVWKSLWSSHIPTIYTMQYQSVLCRAKKKLCYQSKRNNISTLQNINSTGRLNAIFLLVLISSIPMKIGPSYLRDPPDFSYFCPDGNSRDSRCTPGSLTYILSSSGTKK